jgi:hypothetical protein
MGRFSIQEEKEGAMRTQFVILFLIFFISFSGCQEVVEAPELDQFIFDETEAKGQLEMNLSWTVNGVKDDGMIADLNIYLSSSDIDYTELDESLSAVNISTTDYHGGTRIIPSGRTLKDFNRYFIGVAFNGILPGATVTYPLTIRYSLKFFLSTESNEPTITEGEFVVTSPEMNEVTNVKYFYTMDIKETDPEAEYKGYIIRQLETPIVLSRPSDVEITDTFSATKNLYVEMIWKVNGQVQGFKLGDLDLYLHDINDTDIEDADDLDFYSLSESTYERIVVGPANTFFAQSVPEKLGFYFYSDMTDATPVNVEYLYKVYSYESKIKRFTVYGSFTSPPVIENDGSFYFGADITLNGAVYTVQKLPAVVQWQP